MLNDFARDQLGRSLTKQETEKYAKRFNKMEKSNEQVTVTTPSGPALSTSVQKLATTKDEMLRKIVTKNPDFAKYQIDTTVMDMFVNRIKKGQEVLDAGR